MSATRLMIGHEDLKLERGRACPRKLQAAKELPKQGIQQYVVFSTFFFQLVAYCLDALFGQFLAA